MQDPDVLPHMHGMHELAKLFLLLEAPPPRGNVEDWEAVHVECLLDEFQASGRRGGHAPDCAPLGLHGSERVWVFDGFVNNFGCEMHLHARRR